LFIFFFFPWIKKKRNEPKLANAVCASKKFFRKKEKIQRLPQKKIFWEIAISM